MNILYLIDKYYFDKKMSRGRVEYGKAIAKHRDVNLKWFGPGWKQWDNDRSLVENVKQLSFTPHVVWSYKADAIPGVEDLISWVRVVAFNEANNVEKTVEEIKGAAANLVVFHHLVDYRMWKDRLGDIECVHIPHAAAPQFFKYAMARTEERPIRCLLSGVLSKEIYPLRQRFAELIHLGEIAGEVRRHPGYRLLNVDQNAEQFRSYAKHLGMSKVSLTCSSRYGYGLAKWAESAAAGCLLVGDVPEEYQATLGKYCQRVTMQSTDDEIKGAVEAAVARTTGKTSESYLVSGAARRFHSMPVYADEFVKACQAVIDRTSNVKSQK